MMRFLAIAVSLLASTSLAQNNVLLVTIDDVGVDGIAVYGEGSTPAPTPTLTALARRGVLFRNAYATPACTSTRATLHTGRFGFRTGIGSAGGSLSLGETALPEILPSTYASALMGKWHLGNGTNSPNQTGWGHFSGGLTNIPDYTNWTKTVNGQSYPTTVYATTDTVNDAIAWINAQTRPWVLCLNFHAPHSPFHAPPSNLHTYKLSGNPQRNVIPHFKAMLQAMDTEFGRLLAQIGSATIAKTNIIVMGDNGTSGKVLEPPFGGAAKFSVYEAGINVPLIVAGPAVSSPGREITAFVHSVDLFHTVAELTGVDARTAVPAGIELDGISMVPYLTNASQSPLRSFVYGEHFGRNRTASQSLRDARYKVILEAGSNSKFFDLQTDPHETTDLMTRALSERENYHHDLLGAELERMAGNASWFPFGTGCAGSAGLPTLTAVSGDRPISGQNFQTQLGNLHASVAHCIGVFGLKRADLNLALFGLPGCMLHTESIAIFPLTATQGVASWTLFVPQVPELLGLGFVQQAIVFEPGVNQYGFVLTNAGAGIIERN